jgi:HSP90 family molecular chaperone
MAREQLSFETDAAIIARLGQELVAKQETALAELVKNAFDADATDVVVRFSNESGKNLLEIIDNGLGMSRKELLAGFMRLASDTKAQEPKSKKFKRKRAGRKGIGRFAAQRLGARLELTTRAKGEKDALRLIVDWSKFSAGTNLEDVSVFLEPAERTSIGTCPQKISTNLR